MLFASCTTAKKANKFLNENPEFAAKQCAERFPIKERIDTIMIEDKELIEAYHEEYRSMSKMIDSLLMQNCDTVYVDSIIRVINKIPCKPEIKYIIKTQENTAKVAAATIELEKQKTVLIAKDIKIKDQQATIHKQRKNNMWLWFIIACLVIFSFRRQIAKLIV